MGAYFLSSGILLVVSKTVSVQVTLIRDGEVLWDEINDLGSNETWLKSELHTQNITDYKDVFLQNGLKETDFLYRL
ncbi:uncharacterized membrane protein YcaP (DUF421 family) [Neobacillus cucumis]|nr:uncharacterized membrane protein YcaP (DUF421 family) [Neobacillus cucumis]